MRPACDPGLEERRRRRAGACPGGAGAQRSAAPNGSDSACTQATPCSLQEAVGKAAANDEVIPTSGTYSLTAAIYAPSEASNLYIRGEFSGPMPKTEASVSTAPINFVTSGDRLSYLDILNQHESAWGANFAAASSGQTGKLRSRSWPTPTATRPPSRAT
jgi:hypothetical protein